MDNDKQEKLAALLQKSAHVRLKGVAVLKELQAANFALAVEMSRAAELQATSNGIDQTTKAIGIIVRYDERHAQRTEAYQAVIRNLTEQMRNEVDNAEIEHAANDDDDGGL